MKRRLIFFLGFLGAASLYIIWALSNSKMHDFAGKCQMCHVNEENLILIDDIERACSQCHTIDAKMSHPVNVRPNKNIPLSTHLDKNGLMTCTTCHDVHKEDKASGREELSGLLWGHIGGRAFCSLCHNTEGLGMKWQHQTAIPYAHPFGKLTENSGGSLLDKYSAECLSCHDGTISQAPRVEVKAGLWQHGEGLNHPVGVDYPHSEDFRFPESLPQEVRLFDGRVGCLSCHEIYTKERNLLVMNNHKSRLCLTCHKK